MQFNPNLGDTQGEADLAVLDKQLFYFHRGQVGDSIWLGVCSKADEPEVADNWTYPDTIPKDEVGCQVVTRVRPAPFVDNEHLYLFWFDKDWDRPLVTRRVATPGAAWGPYVQLGDTSSLPITEEPGAIAVVRLNQSVLVCIVRETRIDFYTYGLDVFESIPPEGTWPAKASSSLDLTPYTKGAVLEATAALFSLGGAKRGPDGAKPLPGDVTGNWLTLMVTDAESEKVLTIRFPLQVSGMPVQGSASSTPWSLAEISHPRVRSDPGGRLMGTARDGSGKACVFYMNTTTPDQDWALYEHLVGFDVNDAPALVFVLGDLLIDDQTGNTSRLVNLVTIGGDSHIYGDTRAYGTGLRVMSTEATSLDLTALSAMKAVNIDGYIDGPFPVPLENVLLDPERLDATVTYGNERGVEQGNTFVEQMSIGVKSTGDAAPEVGMGPTWDISLSVGAGFSQGTTRFESVAQTVAIPAELERDSNPVRLRRTGVALISSIVLHCNEYQFIPFGSTVPVQDAPRLYDVYLDRSDGKPITFDIGTATPGDLESYSESAWNSRMLPLYPGKEYIRDVVEVSGGPAVSLEVENGTPAKKLTLVWSDGIRTSTSLGSTVETFESSSITLDASVFAGVSAKFLGAEANLMVGFEAKVEATKNSKTAKSIGLDAAVSMAGPTSREAGVKSYTVDIYFLKSSRDWVTELRYFSADQPLVATLPAGSECWKIMYVSRDVTWNDYLSDLARDGLTEAHIDDLRARGITTTDLLLAHLDIPEPSALATLPQARRDGPDGHLLSALQAWDRRRNRYPKAPAR